MQEGGLQPHSNVMLPQIEESKSPWQLPTYINYKVQEYRALTKNGSPSCSINLAGRHQSQALIHAEGKEKGNRSIRNPESQRQNDVYIKTTHYTMSFSDTIATFTTFIMKALSFYLLVNAMALMETVSARLVPFQKLYFTTRRGIRKDIFTINVSTSKMW
jgi:hypothetical protein